MTTNDFYNIRALGHTLGVSEGNSQRPGNTNYDQGQTYHFNLVEGEFDQDDNGGIVDSFDAMQRNGGIVKKLK